jgi:L-iditol 2-dehydrogenase
MKALVLEAYNELVYEDVPEPTIAADEVIIEVKACGICGSDVHGMDGSTGRRIPPIIMGHEAAGVIRETGPAVKGWQPGERVTFDSTIYCGECYYCRAGQVNLCDNRRVLGVSPGTYRQHGAFADYVAVPERVLYRLPDSVSFTQAAMLEPLSVAFHAASLPKIRLGDSAVVVGAGMIGLLVIRALRLAGCGQIVAVDLDAGRLDAAKQFGADAGLISGEDTAQKIQAMTDGRGADLGFEVVGITAAIQTALASVRKGGSLTLVGNLSPTIELPLQSAVTRQITLHGSCASSGEYPACIEMLARGAVDVSPLISAVVPLRDAAGWFDRLHRREPGLMKVIVEPGG